MRVLWIEARWDSFWRKVVLSVGYSIYTAFGAFTGQYKMDQFFVLLAVSTWMVFVSAPGHI
jgi:hypothetical protein